MLSCKNIWTSVGEWRIEYREGNEGEAWFGQCMILARFVNPENADGIVTSVADFPDSVSIFAWAYDGRLLKTVYTKLRPVVCAPEILPPVHWLHRCLQTV